MEQQTPISPKSRMKLREGQKRSIFPSLIWAGEGGSRFSIYFVQDCRHRVARNFCGSLFLWVGVFVCFAGTNFWDLDRLVFVA